VVLSGSKLRGFDQYMLNMLVALFGKGCPEDLVCGTLFLSAQPAIADRLLHRPEARYIPNLQRPGERSNPPLRDQSNPERGWQGYEAMVQVPGQESDVIADRSTGTHRARRREHVDLGAGREIAGDPVRWTPRPPLKSKRTMCVALFTPLLSPSRYTPCI
jgi:hypothetical protein